MKKYELYVLKEKQLVGIATVAADFSDIEITVASASSSDYIFAIQRAVSTIQNRREFNVTTRIEGSTLYIQNASHNFWIAFVQTLMLVSPFILEEVTS